MTVRSILLLILLAASVGIVQASRAIVPVEQAFGFFLADMGHGRYVLHAQVMPGFALYRDSIKMTSAGKAVAADLPTGRSIHDPVLGDQFVLSGDVQLPLEIDASTTDAVLTVRYRGCQVDVLCYPPQTVRFAL